MTLHQNYSRLTEPTNGYSISSSAPLDQDGELEAAFDDPEEEPNQAETADEHARLVLPDAGNNHLGEGTSWNRSPAPAQPEGSYDFEQDHYQPDPSFPPPPSIRLIGMGGGIQNDGVFANLSAKPDGPRLQPDANGQMQYVGGNDDGGPNDKEEALPNYDTAALDSAPPYWETTVTLPGAGAGAYGMLGADDILVDGMPVGNLFGFAWNLLVSMSFQFIGFLLTYLLHTTHAAKNGSRAGLGITLIQYGLYTRSRAAELSHAGSTGSAARNATSSFPPTTTDPWGLFGPSPSASDWDGSTAPSGKGPEMPYDNVPTSEQLHLSSVANEWLSYMLIAVGWFLLLGGLVNYWRAVRWARAVRSEETMVGSLA